MQAVLAGTDEHGEKIAEAAASKGQQPQEHCDAVVSAFKALWGEVPAPLPFALATGLIGGLRCFLPLSSSAV